MTARLIECPTCTALAPQGTKSCQGCGEPLHSIKPAKRRSGPTRFVKCPYCQFEIRDTAKKCRACSREVQWDKLAKCPNCSANVPLNVDVCSTCKEKITWVSPRKQKRVRSCVDCGGEISTQAPVCPHCGRTYPVSKILLAFAIFPIAAVATFALATFPAQTMLAMTFFGFALALLLFVWLAQNVR